MIVKQNDRKIFRLHSYHVLLVFLLTAIRTTAQTSSEAPTASAPQTQTTSQPPQAGQANPQQPGVLAPGKTAQGEDKYIFGVLPNYRTAEMTAVGRPLTPKQKLTIATKDSFAYPLVLLGAAYAGLYQLENSHPEFGQGVEGYAKRFGTSYSDQVIGNYMTEAVFPIILKQDPRYFRMAHGTKGQRAWYAATRIFVSRTDSGKSTVNYSELMGNAVAAGIGLSYYPDDRDVPDYLQNWGIQLGTDATSQVLKEFWPDVKAWWHRRHDEKYAP
jgi:hypothetical protein